MADLDNNPYQNSLSSESDPPVQPLFPPVAQHKPPTEKILLMELDRLRDENVHLKQKMARITVSIASMKDQYDALQCSTQVVINRQVIAEEYLDTDSDRHIDRIGRFAGLLARVAGVHDLDAQLIEFAAPFHDIGKAQVSRDILNKPGKLSEIEFIEVKLHTIFGSRMLAGTGVPLLNKAREIALSHHENWNGSGYPMRLREKKIPFCGRIVRIVDCFDTLTSRRPHKMAYPIDVAFDIIQQQRGRFFDPELVDCMHGALDSFIRLKAEIDTPSNLPETTFAFSERDFVPGNAFFR